MTEEVKILPKPSDRLWCITTYFNPANFNSLLNNYFVFSEKLAKQGVNLITVELAFNDEPFRIPAGPNVYHLRSNSIMFQKERLINYGMSKLPPEAKYFAWLDCDLIFTDPNWEQMAIEKLQTAHIIQLFKRARHLPQGMMEHNGEKTLFHQGIAWQYKTHKNWLARRKSGELPFSHPGFAWAARRDVFQDIGVYDKNVLGSGDTFLIDCYLNSWEIHGYAHKFNEKIRIDMMEWRELFDKKGVTIDYIPVEIHHLWHGTLKNRNYVNRHEMLERHDYDPKKDVKIINNVFEWSSNKPDFHNELKNYFVNRQEDTP